MWWIFLFLLIIGLVLDVIVFSIPSILLWGSSLLIGGLFYIYLKSNFFESTKDNVHSDVVTILLTKEDDITFTIDGSKIETLIKKYKISLIIWFITFTIYIILFLLSIEGTQMYLFVDPLDIPKSLGTTGTFSKEAFLIVSFISSTIVIGYLLKKLSPDKRLLKILNNNLQSDINNFKADYKEINNLNNIIPTIEKYSKELVIFFPTNYKREIQTEINDNKSSIFKDIGLIKKIVSTKIALANSDKTNLDNCIQLYSNFLNFYNKVNINVLKTTSQSYVNRLDYLLHLMEQAKNSLLPNREWTKFEEILNELFKELNILNGLAINFIENPILDDDDEELEFDPYTVLGVNKEMTLEEIKKKYTDLKTKFHPDRVAHLANEYKIFSKQNMDKIEKAFNKIEKERKIR